MIPDNFEYHKPSNVDEVIALLSKHGDEAKILAGGHSLLPMMKLRFAEPLHLVDINGIDELRGISTHGDVIHIGAMTTETSLVNSDLLAQKCPLIPEAAKLIGDPQIRNLGTIGGDIAHGDPGNDHPAIMMALDAEFVLKSEDGERVVAANDFFHGTYWTELAEGEIMTEIRIPVAGNNTGHGFNKLKRKTGDFATAAAAVVLRLEGNTCADIRITLTNVGPMALKAVEAENVLRGHVITETLIEDAA